MGRLEHIADNERDGRGHLKRIFAGHGVQRNRETPFGSKLRIVTEHVIAKTATFSPCSTHTDPFLVPVGKTVETRTPNSDLLAIMSVRSFSNQRGFQFCAFLVSQVIEPQSRPSGDKTC